jgi:hypothetical protein
MENDLGLSEAEQSLINIYGRLKEIPEVPEDLLREFLLSSMKLFSRQSSNSIRDFSIYVEYLIYSKKPKGQRLSFGVGKGTWEDRVGKAHHIGASAVRSIITRFKNN